MFTTRQSSNQEIVDYIGLFRSQEYIAAIGREKFSAPLPERNLADIAASFVQGLEYIKSADQASLQIKPMLQYYGILNLVKGLCGLRYRDKGRSVPVSTHGLQRHSWDSHLTKEKLSFLDLEVVTTKAESGAFAQVVSRAWHRNVVDAESMYPGPPWRITFIQQLGTLQLSKPGARIRLRELLARSRYVADTYATVTGESPKIHPVHMVAGSGQVGLYPVRLSRRDDSFSEHLKSVGSSRTYRSPHSKGEVAATFFSEDDPNCPVLHEGTNLFGWAIEPMPSGDRPAEWIKLYVLSYIFGMLCRYYPSQWLTLISDYGAPPDGPIIHRSLHGIQQHFLREFSLQLAALIGDAYFMGPDMGYFSEMMVLDEYWT